MTVEKSISVSKAKNAYAVPIKLVKQYAGRRNHQPISNNEIDEKLVEQYIDMFSKACYLD